VYEVFTHQSAIDLAEIQGALAAEIAQSGASRRRVIE